MCQKAIKGMDVQKRLGQQPLELSVIKFKLAQPFGLTDVQAAVLGAPIVKRRITETVITADRLNRHASLGLPEKANDLHFAEFSWLACQLFSR
jgi:hypothetical protein